jgi:uncharacterized membrane protein SpoIIM required for sporulation
MGLRQSREACRTQRERMIARLILRFLLVVGLVLAAKSPASALVRIDVDLASQTMHVRSGSGETYV